MSHRPKSLRPNPTPTRRWAKDRKLYCHANFWHLHKKCRFSRYQLSVETDTHWEKLASFPHEIESYKPINEEFH